MKLQKVNPNSELALNFKDLFITALLYQKLKWTDIKDGATFQMEVLTPSRAKCYPKGNGHYIHFLAYVEHAQKQAGISSDSYIEIHLPLKTWINAVQALPLDLKRPFIELNNDNMVVTVHKVKENLVHILDLQKRVPSPEQKDKALDYYPKPSFRRLEGK